MPLLDLWITTSSEASQKQEVKLFDNFVSKKGIKGQENFRVKR